MEGTNVLWVSQILTSFSSIKLYVDHSDREKRIYAKISNATIKSILKRTKTEKQHYSEMNLYDCLFSLSLMSGLSKIFYCKCSPITDHWHTLLMQTDFSQHHKTATLVFSVGNFSLRNRSRNGNTKVKYKYSRKCTYWWYLLTVVTFYHWYKLAPEKLLVAEILHIFNKHTAFMFLI